MIHKTKVLSFAVVAIAAMSMAAASTVQASELHATTSAANVSVFGQQTEQHAFATKAGQVKCTTATEEATVTDQGQSSQQLTATELTITPTYTGCTAFGLAATVTMNGCKYTVTNKSGAGVTTAKTAYVDVVCSATQGKVIEVKNATCTMTVGPQNNLGQISFTNSAETPYRIIVIKVIIIIVYQAHGVCPNMAATEQVANGQYTGQSTFEAREDAGTQQVTLHGHQYNKLAQTGALIGLQAT